ncbi:hypothetical protein E2C01_029085 [Portunus trituberculatus]|uniref:Uncharacterized protein n=1 Tax=Portunus trituberculatus TaxID=210409 RepID=A0A5B7ER19_PORTR|nr:hypothetical protein [Portunus trituberculatus]
MTPPVPRPFPPERQRPLQSGLVYGSRGEGAEAALPGGSHAYKEKATTGESPNLSRNRCSSGFKQGFSRREVLHGVHDCGSRDPAASHPGTRQQACYIPRMSTPKIKKGLTTRMEETRRGQLRQDEKEPEERETGCDRGVPPRCPIPRASKRKKGPSTEE